MRNSTFVLYDHGMPFYERQKSCYNIHTHAPQRRSGRNAEGADSGDMPVDLAGAGHADYAPDRCAPYIVKKKP
jgi:hypothetical protein